LSVVSTAQSMSFMQSTQRLFGRSHLSLPVGLVVQFAVPHAITQVLAELPIVLHVAPAGQCEVSMH
jgi:hypothetical protein